MEPKANRGHNVLLGQRKGPVEEPEFQGGPMNLPARS